MAFSCGRQLIDRAQDLFTFGPFLLSVSWVFVVCVMFCNHFERVLAHHQAVSRGQSLVDCDLTSKRYVAAAFPVYGERLGLRFIASSQQFIIARRAALKFDSHVQLIDVVKQCAFWEWKVNSFAGRRLEMSSTTRPIWWLVHKACYFDFIHTVFLVQTRWENYHNSVKSAIKHLQITATCSRLLTYSQSEHHAECHPRRGGNLTAKRSCQALFWLLCWCCLASTVVWQF